jgi:hypothetical protein
MNLLEKAKIITTATAYDNGKLHSVKGGEVADFDVVRGSLATRVNAEGLIEDISVLSGELVSDGSFDTEGVELVSNGSFDASTNWNLGTGWSVSDGKATSGLSGLLQQSTSELTAGKTYKTSFEITEYTSGGVKLYSGSGSDISPYKTSLGTHVTYFVANGNTTSFYSDNFIGSIDNVSVKEVAADWSLGTGWSVSDGKVTKSGTDLAYLTHQSLTSIVGKTYRVRASITNVTTGNIRLDNFTIGTTYTSDIEIDETHTATTAGAFRFLGWAGFDGSIDNISVVEIIDATNIPRIDYTTGEGVVLLEPQSTNSIEYSEDFSDASYIKDAGVSVGTTDNESPSTTSSATKIDVSNSGRIYSNVATNTYYTSVFIKGGVFSYFKLAGVNVDLVSETIASGTMESFGNGWFRIGTTYTGNRPFQIQAYPDATYATHTDVGDYYIWGAQAEALPYATSYIPTSGAIATRLADSVTGAGDATTFNSTEGVLYFEGSAAVDGVGTRTISLSDGTANNSITIRYTASLGVIQAFVVSGGSFRFNANMSGVSVLDLNKVAIRYKENDFSLWINGVEVATGTSGSTPSGLSELNFTRGDGANKFSGKVKALAVFNEALTDSELECLTTI